MSKKHISTRDFSQEHVQRIGNFRHSIFGVTRPANPRWLPKFKSICFLPHLETSRVSPCTTLDGRTCALSYSLVRKMSHLGLMEPKNFQSEKMGLVPALVLNAEGIEFILRGRLDRTKPISAAALEVYRRVMATAEAQLRGFQDATDLPARRAEEERRDIESIQWRHHPTPQSARVPTDDSFTATVAQVLHARRQGASEEVVGEILDRGPRNLSRMAQRVVREVEAMTSSKSARVKDVLDAGPPPPKLDHAAIAGVGQRGVGLCRIYKATEAELASFGVASVEEMVDQLNSHLDKIKDDPIYASYPTSRAAFQRLAFRWRCLEVSSKEAKRRSPAKEVSMRR